MEESNRTQQAIADALKNFQSRINRNRNDETRVIKQSGYAEKTGPLPARQAQHAQPKHSKVVNLTRRFLETPGTYVLYGPNHTGKTTLAISIFKAWPKNARWTSSFDLLSEIKQTFDVKGSSWERPKSNLLVIDEFEKINATEWALTTLDAMIRYRHDNLKTTILITNCTVSEFTKIITGAVSARIKESRGMIEIKKPWWEDKPFEL